MREIGLVIGMTGPCDAAIAPQELHEGVGGWTPAQTSGVVTWPPHKLHVPIVLNIFYPQMREHIAQVCVEEKMIKQKKAAIEAA